MNASTSVLKGFKGLNLQQNSEIKDGELVDAQNVVITQQETIKKRPGCQTVSANLYNDLGNNARILINYGSLSPSANFLMVGSSSKIAALYRSSGTYALGTTSVLSSTAESAIQYNDKVVIFSTGTTPITFDATSSTAGTYTQITGIAGSADYQGKATFAITHKDRIFFLNNKGAYPSRLYYTTLSSTNDFTSAAAAYVENNYIDVGEGDGDFLVCAAELNDALILFKRFSTWILYTEGGPTTGWYLRKAHATVGCTGRDTPYLITNLVYFLAGDGVYRTDGTTFEHISNPVDPGMVVPNGTFSADACNRAAAVRWKDWYVIRKNYEEDRLAFVYGWRTNTWTLWNLPSYAGPMVNDFSNVSNAGMNYPSGVGGGGASVTSAASSELVYLDYKRVAP